MLIVDFIFGHAHDLSRVFTIRGRTYRVCLACGEEQDCSAQEIRDWNAGNLAVAELERILTL